MNSLLALTLALVVATSEAGVSYVRWGRNVCPTGVHLLYKGFMTGPYIDGGGSGSNYLCAHEDPKFVRAVAARQPWTALLFGVELEAWQAEYNNLFVNDNVGGGPVHNADLPCAVCYVAESTDKLMIPGRPDCGATGYDLQYKGFLVAEAFYAARQRTEFVCLDEAPEGRSGGSADNNNAVVYPVQAGCGSLPCTPYVEGFEITCAVCTY